MVKLDAIQINLADDHYLKVGIALQASKDAGEELDGSKALDADDRRCSAARAWRTWPAGPSATR